MWVNRVLPVEIPLPILSQEEIAEDEPLNLLMVVDPIVQLMEAFEQKTVCARICRIFLFFSHALA